jgi:hypothetical protein
MDEDEPTGRRIFNRENDVTDTLELNLKLVEDLGVQDHPRLGPAAHSILVP